MSALALALALSVAAAPNFASVAKKFPPLTLPLDSKALVAPKTTLSAAELKVLALEKHGGGELAELLRWAEPPEKELGAKNALRAIGSVQRGDTMLLVISVEYEGPAVASLFQTYLVAYSSKGEFLDALRFSTTMSSEAAAVEERSTFNAEGGLGRRATTHVPMMEEGLPEQLTVVSDQVGKLTSKGTFELAVLDFRTRDGAFVEEKTKEELRVFGDEVYYRANESKPFQKLFREGDTVRFKQYGQTYSLSWDQRRANLKCINPDGSVQTFARKW
ncbi:MAG: hypothetical protein QM817_25920 [Archangium sp.]